MKGNICQTCKRRRCNCTPQSLRKRIRELELSLHAARKLAISSAILDTTKDPVLSSELSDLIPQAMHMLEEVVKVSVPTHSTGLHTYTYVSKSGNSYTLHYEEPITEKNGTIYSPVTSMNHPWIPEQLLQKIKGILEQFSQKNQTSEDDDYGF